MVIPHALDSTQEAVALDGKLDGLGASSKCARAGRTARTGKGGNDALLGESLEILGYDALEPRIELLAICRVSVVVK